MIGQEDWLQDLRNTVLKEVKIIRELISIYPGLEQTNAQEERDLITSQVTSLKSALRKASDEVSGILEDMSITKPLPSSQVKIPIPKAIKPEIKAPAQKIEIIEKPRHIFSQSSGLKKEKKEKKTKHKIVGVEITELEKKIIKRLKKKKKRKEKRKEKKASRYVSLSNKFFGEISQSLSKTQMFLTLKTDLIKANLQFISRSYISMMLFTTFLSVIAGIIIFMFFLFFNMGMTFPIITKVTENVGARALKTFWILLAVPLATFTMMYVYPSLEKKHAENKINQELPFATIHMSAISGSMVEPSKMFNILISTKEYPNLEKEFTKIINEINIYGHDFVTALRKVAVNSPSQKFAEVLNGIATTINSGGNLPDFFEKRAQSLLFDYKIEREKYTKTAETFMDIYISLVIAAPMILMLLLMMMRVSRLGLSLSTSMITLIMVLGVTMVNIIFLTFLQLKQPPA